MSLHPIRALEHVLDEYRGYLLTEFRAKDAKLRAALERELDAPRFLAQEPFFQAHRPFKPGKAWWDLPIDARLAEVMEQRSGTKKAFLHQSQAILELLSPDARPVVVTTGTGSGSPQAFMLYCRSAARASGAAASPCEPRPTAKNRSARPPRLIQSGFDLAGRLIGLEQEFGQPPSAVNVSHVGQAPPAVSCSHHSAIALMSASRASL